MWGGGAGGLRRGKVIDFLAQGPFALWVVSPCAPAGFGAAGECCLFCPRPPAAAVRVVRRFRRRCAGLCCLIVLILFGMKKCEAFLKLYRDYFRSVFWCKERRFSEAEALLDLLAEARFGTVRVVQRMGGAEVLVGRGQLALTLRYLARRWQWSVHRVQLFLSLLRDMGYVELETHRQFHLLTVADLTDFGGFPVVRQEVTTPSARRRKAGRDASGGASAQPAGYSSGTPCGTKKKKEEKNKETSLTRGKERAEPSLGEGFGVLLAEGAMPSADGDGRPPYVAGLTGARAECAMGVPDGSATQDGGKRGDAECSRKAPDAGTALAHGRKQTGADGVQDTASQGAESRRAGAECPPRGCRSCGGVWRSFFATGMESPVPR